MSQPEALTINTDGASRGNPGPAAFAYVIARAGSEPIEESGCLGRTTNNQAEYEALIRALERVAALGTHYQLHIRMDSDLIVKQMRGEYRVKDANMRPLHERAMALWRRFEHRPSIEHVRREQNSRADQLCNEALDGARRCAGAPSPPARRAASPGNPNRLAAARAEAIACLRAAAGSWAARDPNAPSPEDVYDQLWSILEEEGVVRRSGAPVS